MNTVFSIMLMAYTASLVVHFVVASMAIDTMQKTMARRGSLPRSLMSIKAPQWPYSSRSIDHQRPSDVSSKSIPSSAALGILVGCATFIIKLPSPKFPAIL